MCVVWTGPASPGGTGEPAGPAGWEVPERGATRLTAWRRRVRALLAAFSGTLRTWRRPNPACPRCRGTGRRLVRGGLYRERQYQPCSCVRPGPVRS